MLSFAVYERIPHRGFSCFFFFFFVSTYNIHEKNGKVNGYPRFGWVDIIRFQHLYPRCDDDGQEIDELCSIHSVIRMYIDSVAINYILVDIEYRLNLTSLGILFDYLKQRFLEIFINHSLHFERTILAAINISIFINSFDTHCLNDW